MSPMYRKLDIFSDILPHSPFISSSATTPALLEARRHRGRPEERGGTAASAGPAAAPAALTGARHRCPPPPAPHRLPPASRPSRRPAPASPHGRPPGSGQSGAWGRGARLPRRREAPGALLLGLSGMLTSVAQTLGTRILAPIFSLQL